MNPVYIRVAIFTMAPVVAALGFGSFDAEARTLTLDLDELVMAVSGASVLNGAIFAKWGKK